VDKTTVNVTFVIKGDDFDPDLITNALNIEPTSCFKKNTNEKPKRITTKIAPEGARKITPSEFRELLNNIPQPTIKKSSPPRYFSLWEIDTGHEESLDANFQLVKIYDLLKGKVEILKQLKSEYKLIYFIEIVPHVENGETPALYLENHIIEFAHEIKATVDIDLYIYS
jgi:hypothetical protein